MFKQGPDFLRDKQLFKIIEVAIMRVDCISKGEEMDFFNVYSLDPAHQTILVDQMNEKLITIHT